MNDLISREMLIHSLCSYDEEPAKYCVPCREVLEIVKSIPSIPIWIPCSERLPETDEIMIVTYIDDRDGEYTIWLGWHEMDNIWYIDGFAHGGEYGNRVIAWKPLPEPYKEAEA